MKYVFLTNPHNPKVVGSRFQLGIIARIRRCFALRKRHQNKHLDFDPFACHTGGREFESRRPRHFRRTESTN